MNALSGSIAERTRAAFAAGCDVVLHCNGRLDEMVEVAAATPELSGMSSIMTNSGAIAALDTLRTVGRNMSETQKEVATGLRVGTASDNAAYWSITTTMRSDDKAMTSTDSPLGSLSVVPFAAVQVSSSIGARLIDGAGG